MALASVEVCDNNLEVRGIEETIFEFSDPFGNKLKLTCKRNEETENCRGLTREYWESLDSLYWSTVFKDARPF